MGSNSSSDTQKGHVVDVDFSNEVHNIFKQFKGTKDSWKREHLNTLITQITSITKGRQDVYVTVCIEDFRQGFGNKGYNRITVTLQDKAPFIAHTWTRKTTSLEAQETFETIMSGVVNAVKSFWGDIVDILKHVGQGAISGGAMKAITSA